jgi:hypothetical protein
MGSVIQPYAQTGLASQVNWCLGRSVCLIPRRLCRKIHLLLCSTYIGRIGAVCWSYVAQDWKSASNGSADLSKAPKLNIFLYELLRLIVEFAEDLCNPLRKLFEDRAEFWCSIRNAKERTSNKKIRIQVTISPGSRPSTKMGASPALFFAWAQL